jgi:hypothetical protein
MKSRPALRWTGVGLALLLSLACLALGLLERRLVDFEVNDRAARRIPLGETLYRSEDGHFQFKYPPAAAFIYLPLTVLPTSRAKAVWLFLNLVALGASLRLALRLALGERDVPWTLWLLPPLIMGKFLLRELELGQINLLILLLMLLSARFLVRAETEKRTGFETAAGALWGAATALKPYTLVFLPYFLVRGKFKALAAGAACLAASFVLPGLYYGVRGDLAVFREWIRSLTKSTPQLLTSQDNISFFAWAAKHIEPRSLAGAVGLGAVGVLAAIFLVLVLKGRGLGRGTVFDVFLLLLLTPLVSPLGWDYTLLAGLPAVVLLLRDFDRFPAAGRVGLAVILAAMPLFLYDVFGRVLYASLMEFGLPTAEALALAGFLSFLRWRRLA